MHWGNLVTENPRIYAADEESDFYFKCQHIHLWTEAQQKGNHASRQWPWTPTSSRGHDIHAFLQRISTRQFWLIKQGSFHFQEFTDHEFLKCSWAHSVIATTERCIGWGSKERGAVYWLDFKIPKLQLYLKNCFSPTVSFKVVNLSPSLLLKGSASLGCSFYT